MSEENLKKFPIDQHYQDIKECKKILTEVKRTVDTNGTYCPFNKVYPHQFKVVQKIREILRDEIER